MEPSKARSRRDLDAGGSLLKNGADKSPGRRTSLVLDVFSIFWDFCTIWLFIGKFMPISLNRFLYLRSLF